LIAGVVAVDRAVVLIVGGRCAPYPGRDLAYADDRAGDAGDLGPPGGRCDRDSICNAINGRTPCLPPRWSMSGKEP
jgi:hypothetical protein